MPGTLFIVSTPIGNLEDITLRALRVLREVQVVAAEDTRRTAGLLQHFGVTARTVSLHEHNEHARIPVLLERLAAGDSVALVSDAGTPILSDPGLGLVRAALERGLTVVPIPGPSAITAALAVAGLPVEGFSFQGFPPARSGERQRWLERLREVPGTLVFFEAPHRIRATLRDVLQSLGDRQVVIARELTKLHETVERGWLSELIEQDWPDRGEFTILVSDQTRPGQDAAGPLNPDEWVTEVGQLTENDGLSTKDAVATVADRHGVSRQDVYRALRR